MGMRLTISNANANGNGIGGSVSRAYGGEPATTIEPWLIPDERPASEWAPP